MAKSRRMTADELQALASSDIDSVINFTADAASAREKALRYFEADPQQLSKWLPISAGRSKVVSRDVADTIGLIKPGLSRVFFGSDILGRYEPTRQQIETDETGKKVDLADERARQATDYANYTMLKESDGYRHLNAGINDGLLHGNGLLKHWWDPTVEYSTESFTGLTDEAYYELVADPEVEEVLEHSEYPDESAAGEYGSGGASPGSDIGQPMGGVAEELGDAASGGGGGQGDLPPQLPPSSMGGMAQQPPTAMGATPAKWECPHRALLWALRACWPG
jgi:hypothetical protein